MEDILSKLGTLDESQLRTAVLGAGLNCGPITSTTRDLFEKKLARILMEKGAGEKDTPGPNGLLGAECKDCDQSPEQTLTVEDTEKEKCASPHEEIEKSTPESSIVYYGVCPQRDDTSGIDETVHVYAHIRTALRAMERMKDARLKVFPSRKEAEDYSKGMHENRQSMSSPLKGQLIPESDHVGQAPTKSEKPNDYPSPKTQDLTAKLRKAVENGDELFFTKLVWDNPRFLIGCGDNPTIVQLGCRYNILHVAAKENQPGIVRLLLSTLENPEFMRHMYQDDDEETLHRRIRYIVDLYLNTPDQSSNDTPLHLACKFGFPEVVNILCSHPTTNKHQKNKCSQKPSDVICQRQNKTLQIKNKIKNYMEDRCYVCLLRDTDNSFQPTISLSSTPRPLEVPSPERGATDPVWTVSAYVGPLSPAKGESFYKLWRNPSRDRAQYFHNILKSDPNRGAERVGRQIAHSQPEHPWAEYWHFLHDFVDLATGEGLDMLEKYLEGKDGSSVAPSHHKGAGSRACTPMAGRHTPPLPGSSAGAAVCNLLTRFEEANGSKDVVPVPDTEGKGLDLANGNFWNRWEKTSRKQEDEDSKGSSEYFTADDRSERSERSERLAAGERYRGSSASSSSSSVRSLEDAIEDTMLTSDSPSHKLFIEGESLTRLDKEVLSAIENADIDPTKYPLVAKWKNTILSYPSANRPSLASPAQKRIFVEKQDFTCTKLKSP